MFEKGLLAVLASASLAACGGTIGDEASDLTGTEGTITVTGCVEPGSPIGTVVLVPSAAEGELTPGEPEARGTTGEGRVVGSPPGGAYRLIPEGNDIAAYVGKRVRLTGEIANGYTDRMEQGESPAGTRERASGEGDVGVGLRPDRGAGGGAIQPEAAAQGTPGQFLRVRSVEELADSCR